MICDTTEGLVQVTAWSGTSALASGMAVGGVGVPVGATVAEVVSSTEFNLSVAATASGGVNLVFSLFATTQTEYDAVGNAIEVIDPLLNATQTVYDALNRPIQVLHADYTTTLKSYTPASLVTTETDQAGSVTTHEYDAAARHIHIFQPDPVTGQKTSDSPETQMGYDGVGNMTSLINPLGHEWTYVYDQRNRRIEEVQPLVANAEVSGSPMVNPVLQTGYDGVGNVNAKTDARGYETTMAYDNANRLITTTYPAVPVYGSGSPVVATTQTGYDFNGNITQVTDEDGNVTANNYDALNRLIATTTAPEGAAITTVATTGMTRSGVASITNVPSLAGITTGMSVSGLGIPAGTTVSGASGSTVTLTANATQTSASPISVAFVAAATSNIVEVFSHDQVGNRTCVIDGNNLLTLFSYDGLNRLLTTIYDYGTALAKTVSEAYDALNKTSRTDATSRVTEYSYDVLNRLTDVVYVGLLVDNLHYERDPVGNVLSVTHPNESGSLRNVAYTYDKLNRPLSETSNLVTQSHSYDAAGNKLSTVYGGTSRSLAYSYDNLNRESELSDSTSSLNTFYAYDLSGNIVKKTLGNTTTENRVHDGRNRVSTLDNETSGSANLASYAYQYDAAGNVMQVAETYPSGGLGNRTITNAYDGVYRLLTEAIVTTGGGTVTTAYAYDKGHNRTSKAISGGATTTYTIGNGSNGAGANQIVSSSDGVGYAYDGNGNRTGRTIGSNTDTYTYDYENRLTQLVEQTGSSPGTYNYAYDYRTRRVTRTEPGPVTTQIVFDGGLSIIEFTSTASSPTVEYIRGYNYGGGVGGLEYSIRSGTPSFNFYDSRGDVTTKTNASGTVTYQTSYEAFGNQTVSTGTTPLDRQRASTKEQDPTGLLNEGFRYRDPSTGTFLSRDPIGFKAGLNNYSYVHQNPWTKFDPEGLSDDTKKKLAPVHLTGYAEILSEIEHGTILDTARKTVEKDAIHAAYDKAADTGNYLSHGDWARKTEDKSMTAYQLGYQFVKGTGSDSHKFDTSSHMGQEMMNSDYVKAAVLKATEQGMHGNFSPVKAKRQIGEGLVTPVQKLAGDVNFVSGFMNDFFTNPARALQGSISGQAVPVVRKVGNNRVLYVVVQLFDDLGAASATHLPISASQHYGTSILQNNPYGPGGPMRTIHVEYDLQTQPIVLGPANQHLAPPSR